MKNRILFIFITLLLINCSFDKYQIKENNRDPVFISEFNNNYNGHLFWYKQKNDKGRYIKDETGKYRLFDPNKNTIIYIHGWQGVGVFGWLDHSMTEGAGFLIAPITAFISLMYNIPNNGASFPDFKKQLNKYNVAIFDWQNYNNIAKEHENSENLTYIEEYLRQNPIDWPSIPKNLCDELELLVSTDEDGGDIYIAAHSLGNQAIVRAYSMLSDKAKERIKLIALLDPFTTDHYDYMCKVVPGDHHWLTGLTTPWLKEDLTNVIKSSGIIEKLVVIPSSDIGASWVANYAEPLGIKVINEYPEHLPFDGLYAYKTKTLHNKPLDWFFLEEKYNDQLDIK
ncbi:MAG: hypothetical protein KA885_01105 [Spirochaetes bacterium]|nr:hypothetical protein [Spirochaetota bacterium]